MDRDCYIAFQKRCFYVCFYMNCKSLRVDVQISIKYDLSIRINVRHVEGKTIKKGKMQYKRSKYKKA